MSAKLTPTPWQTVGPYFNYCLPWKGGADLVGQSDIGDRADLFVSEDHRRGPIERGACTGEAVTIRGRVLDSHGNPVTNAMLEIWQADPSGRYAQGDEPGAFIGFGRAATGPDGGFEFRTLRPGPVSNDSAPHIAISVLGTGLNARLLTRLYFEGDPRNETDPVLLRVPAERRGVLMAKHDDGVWRHDLILSGPNETVFFKVAE